MATCAMPTKTTVNLVAEVAGALAVEVAAASAAEVLPLVDVLLDGRRPPLPRTRPMPHAAATVPTMTQVRILPNAFNTVPVIIQDSLPTLDTVPLTGSRTTTSLPFSALTGITSPMATVACEFPRVAKR